MSEEARPVTFSEERVPVEGIDEGVDELVDLYGGEMTSRGATERKFTLPLRRGVAAGGGVACTLSWSGDGEVTMTCDRDVDAPKAQRLLLLVAGVVGALLFTIWPFFPQHKQFGALAWIGGAVAVSVYFLSLRKTSGGIALDFLQRLVRRQRETITVDPSESSSQS
jgi:hypothetical protein